jgi:hypothetical protein
MTKPASPGNLKVTSTNGGFKVAWTVPVNSGLPLKTFRVSVEPGALTYFTSATSLDVTGLSNGVEYAVKVAAQNDSGWSPESALTLAYPMNWQTEASGTTMSLNSVAFGNSIFVTVGDSGMILTSPDGLAWSPRPSGVTCKLNNVSSLSTGFIAVGSSGCLLTSPEGLVWTLRNSGVSVSLNGATRHGSGFIVVGDSGTVLTSPDLVNWTLTPKITQNGLRAVASSSSLAIAVGDKMILSSVNGNTWTVRDTTNQFLTSIVWNGTSWVAAGLKTTLWTDPSPGNLSRTRSYPYPTLLHSLDGGVWQDGVTELSSHYPFWEGIKSVAWSGDRLIGVSYSAGSPIDPSIFTSKDGSSWTIMKALSLQLNGVAYGANRWVTVGPEGFVSSATNP